MTPTPIPLPDQWLPVGNAWVSVVVLAAAVGGLFALVGALAGPIIKHWLDLRAERNRREWDREDKKEEIEELDERYYLISEIRRSTEYKDLSQDELEIASQWLEIMPLDLLKGLVETGEGRERFYGKRTRVFLSDPMPSMREFIQKEGAPAAQGELRWLEQKQYLSELAKHFITAEEVYNWDREKEQEKDS